MKINILFFLFFPFLGAIIYATENNDDLAQKLVKSNKLITIKTENLYIHNEPTFNNNNKHEIITSAAPHTVVSNKNRNTQTTSVVTQLSSFISSIKLTQHKDHLVSCFKQNKNKIFFYTVGLAYLVTCGLLIRDNHYLNRTDLWTRWKGDLTFAELCTLSQKTLSQDLLHEIQKRYLNKEQPTDFVSPLIDFMNAIDFEISRISRYIKLCSWLKQLYIILILPTNDVKILQAERQLERLHFIKHIFLSWAAEYNVSHKRPIRRWSKKMMITE